MSGLIINAGQTINLNLTVADSNGILIFDDVPKATIKSLSKNKYFNGLLFVDQPVEIMMPHMGSGVYGFDFMLDSTDELSVEMISEKYEITKTIHLIVIPQDCVHYAKPNEEFVYYTPKSKALNLMCYTLTNEEGLWYVLDSNSWSEMRTFNLVTPVSDELAKIAVTLEEGNYNISVLENTDIKYSFSLKVTNEKGNGEITIVNSANLKGLDGSDTVTLTETGAPLAGVKVTATSIATKKQVGMTTTNDKGEWHMMIERGNYLFTFERQGYTPVSFIKEV